MSVVSCSICGNMREGMEGGGWIAAPEVRCDVCGIPRWGVGLGKACHVCKHWAVAEIERARVARGERAYRMKWKKLVRGMEVE